MKKLVIGALLLVLAACSSGGGSSAAAKPKLPKIVDFQGEMRIQGPGNVQGDLSNCTGAGPYADVRRGSEISVTNAKGKPLATGLVAYGLGTNIYGSYLDECVFKFYVHNVPRASSFLLRVSKHPPMVVPLATVVATGGKVSVDLNEPPPLATPSSVNPAG